MSLGEQRRRPYVEQYKIGPCPEPVMDIPAIGFKTEFGGEMGFCDGGRRSRNNGYLSGFGRHRKKSVFVATKLILL